VLSLFGDNRGTPYVGPVKLKFLDKSNLAVIDCDGGLHIQAVKGGITAHIFRKPAAINSLEEGKVDKKVNSLNDSVPNANEGDKQQVPTIATLQAHNDNDQDSDSDNEDGGQATYRTAGTYADENVSYLDVKFSDICTIPFTKNIAVCDSISNTIKHINEEDWTVDRTIGICEDGSTVFENIISIESFTLGYKTYFCVCERDSDRVMVLSEGGHILHTFGTSGILPGEFDRPTSVACCLMPQYAKCISQPVPQPEWYIGIASKDKIDSNVKSNSNFPGGFRVGQRPKNTCTFDCTFITATGLLARCNIIKNKETGSAAMLTSSGIRMKEYGSVWDVVRNYREFKKMLDPRPYVLFAVVDYNNRRVQVFKYMWMQSDIYVPEVRLAYVVGGYKRGCGVALREPTSVAFTSTGELCICDYSAKQVLVLSHTMQCIHTLGVPFTSHVPKSDVPSGYFDFPNAPPFGKPLRDPVTNEIIVADVPTVDQYPVSVSVSSDGKIAVGYRRGGVLIYNPYKNYDVGAFTVMKDTIFDNILSYCDYGDFEALRECCVAMHNHTRRLRNEWVLSPLRGKEIKTIAVCQFIKWAHVSPLLIERTNRSPIKSPSKSPTKSNSTALIRQLNLLDNKKRVCCYKKWIELLDDTEWLTYSNKKIDKNMCSNIVCPLSHDLPAIESHVIENMSALIDYRCTLLSVTRLFGDEFIWKKEPYIEHLFNALAFLQDVEMRRVGR